MKKRESAPATAQKMLKSAPRGTPCRQLQRVLQFHGTLGLHGPAVLTGGGARVPSGPVRRVEEDAEKVQSRCRTWTDFRLLEASVLTVEQRLHQLRLALAAPEILVPWVALELKNARAYQRFTCFHHVQGRARPSRDEKATEKAGATARC